VAQGAAPEPVFALEPSTLVDRPEWSHDELPARLRQARHTRQWLIFCASVFAFLVVWLLVWPYTGDGDSSLHYQTARDMLVSPKAGMGPWARPLHKLLILLPAAYGIIPTRLTQGLITIALLWQTMRLAEELRFRRPILVGLLLILQPYVFALASDTMTELPFALGMVVAIRLWRAKRVATSSLVIGLLPAVRPEGFLMGPLWAAMLLFTPGLGPVWLRLLKGLPGCVGLLLWSLACHLSTGSWRYFLDVWSWPAGSYATYPSGSIFYHVFMWPDYVGLVLLPLFIAGVSRAVNRKGMWLPLAVWAVVFGAHSIFFWGHWFASFGLMRIMATTSFVTAMICAEGWSAVSDLLVAKGFGPSVRRAMGVALLVLAFGYAAARYWADQEHHQCLAIRNVSNFVLGKGLGKDVPKLFAGDKTFYAELGLPGCSPHAILDFQVGLHDDNARRLKELPAGSLGMWDNRICATWYGVGIEELPGLGYEILFEDVRSMPAVSNWGGLLVPTFGDSPIRYVLVRKKG
jgi:hypothetical protein